MKFSFNWLKDYVAIDLPLSDITGQLTMAGLEVERVQVIGDNWEGVTVGQIVAVDPHPNADRLRLATIDIGSEQPTVVCGAPNLTVGDKVAFAAVGAQLIDSHSGQLFRLKQAKIRGVASSGMACSERELGISDSHEGILILPSEAPLGTPLADFWGDAILDLEITPNRPDCLSVIGLAREVAALTDRNVHLPEISYRESADSIEQKISVEITDPKLCPRYSATLITGVRIAESPGWLQQRLLKYGMRPINNVVDITNYVMVEYGQPLHAFDYRKLKGQKIIVRRAEASEALTTLDGVERTLSGDMLVIADEAGAVALAGVMGGADSEVTDNTTSILLEAASFNPVNIHRTGSILRLSSEAQMRFERGIRPELTSGALRRATQLIIELAGGEAAKGVIDAYPGKVPAEPVRLSIEKMNRVLGVDFTLKQAAAALTRLGFDCQAQATAGEMWVIAPYWRSDINRDVDLIEEVARIEGYDKIPTTLISQPIPAKIPNPLIKLKRKTRQSLVGYGFQEVITYALTSRELITKLQAGSGSPEVTPLRVANPMTAEQEYLRPNLRANVLGTLVSNRRHEAGGIRLFELGKVYYPRPGDLPDEPEVLCGLLCGASQEKSWHGDEESFDFYDAKGIVEALLAHLGTKADFVESSDASLHPNKQAAVVIGDSRLGVIGELHPRVLEAFEIAEPVYLIELNLTELLTLTSGYKTYQPVPRFPAIEWDIALVVNDKATHHEIRNIIAEFPLVTGVALFDVYSGKQVPPGQKSLAYRITFQSPAQTLTDSEVDGIQQQILDRLSREFGATLRR